MRSILFTAFLAMALAGAPAADVTALGGYNENTSGKIAAGAGLPSSFSSLSGVTTLTISNAPGAWMLRVRRSAEGWHPQLKLFVKRSSAGSGLGSIAGGDGFVEVTANELELFSGSGNRSNISIQYKITGLSQTVPPHNYTSSLLFTVR